MQNSQLCQAADQRTNLIARNSMWMALDNVFGLVAATVASILVARTFGPVQMGYYVYVMWFVTMTAALSGRLGLVQVARRYLAEYLGSNRLELARGLMRGLLLVQTVLAVLCLTLVLVVVISTVPAQFRTFAIIGALAIVPSVWLAVPTGGNMAIEDYPSNVKASAVANVVNVLWILITLMLHGGLTSLAAALLVSRLADVGVRVYYLHRNYKPLFEGLPPRGASSDYLPDKEKRRIYVFCVQSVVLQMLNMVVWDRSELLFLKAYSPIEQVAFYSICFSIIQQAATLYRAFASAAGMSLLRRHVHDPHGASHMAGTMVRYMGLFAFPVTLGIAALSKPLMTLLYGSQYLNAIRVLAVMGLFGSARALLMPVEQYTVAAERQDLMVRGTLITSALNITLACLLIPSWGALGAAFCNGICQMVGMIICWTLLRRNFPLDIDFGAIVRILLASLGMAAVVWGIAAILPPFAGLVVGSVAGLLIFLLLLRLLRCLREDDRYRITNLGTRLPNAVRPVYERTVAFLIP